MPHPMTKINAIALFAAVIAGLSAVQSSASEIKVAVTELRSDDGNVICRIFRSDADFPANGAFKAVTTTPSGASAACVFDGLAPGVYAIAIAHDEDEDGELDRNFLGIPSEGYGFSRNPKTLLGPPDFEDAAITLGKTGIPINIITKY